VRFSRQRLDEWFREREVVYLGSDDPRMQKMPLSITRCIVQFGPIEGYGK
jgi:hypothetical protein